MRRTTATSPTALTVHAGTFADWRLGAGGGWGLAQSVPVSIPYGSSS